MVSIACVYYEGDSVWYGQQESHANHCLPLLESYDLPYWILESSLDRSNLQNFPRCLLSCLQPTSLQYNVWLLCPLISNHCKFYLLFGNLPWRCSLISESGNNWRHRLGMDFQNSWNVWHGCSCTWILIHSRTSKKCFRCSQEKRFYIASKEAKPFDSISICMWRNLSKPNLQMGLYCWII